MRKHYFALCVCMGLIASAYAGYEFNGSMELGTPGQSVPGWRMDIMKVQFAEIIQEPTKVFHPVTIQNGKDGYGMKVPVFPSVISYGLDSRYFKIDRNGEVEISFDYKMEASQEGKSNMRCGIDFRAHGDAKIKNAPVANPAYPQYPVLTGARVPGASEWKSFKVRYPVVKWHNDYIFRINVSSTDGKPINTALLMDNIRLEFVGAKKQSQQEAAAVPDHDIPVYKHGETVRLAVRAVLDSAEAEVNGLLELVADYDPSKRVSKNVVLKQERKLNNGQFVYTGKMEFPAETFGSFHAELKIGDKAVDTVGDWAVVHPSVDHPRFSPGWSIGCNFDTFSHASLDEIGKNTTLRYYGSSDWHFDMLRICGMRSARVWGYIREIQKTEDSFDSMVPDFEIKNLKKRGIESVFCLAGGFGMTFKDAGPNPQRADYPRFLYPYLKKLPHRKGGLYLDWPLDKWEKFVQYCLNTWGDSVQIWELFNEPDAGTGNAAKSGMEAQYLKYLESTWKTIKKNNPNFLLLGNGNTCDVGFAQNWCARLNKVNPDYVNWLDGIAFHPYNNSTDCFGGVYNLYSKHIKDLRSSLKVQKPLWNTECYYIDSARHPQPVFYKNQTQCDANDVQRHYLDGMLNGVVSAMPLHIKTLMKFDPLTCSPVTPLSEAGVALNALSWMLKDMQKLEPVNRGSFVRAGIFRSADGKSALGVLYDFRPAGSTITPPATVKTMDLFGNVLAAGKDQVLSYEPVYFAGNTKNVEQVIRNIQIKPRGGCPVFARIVEDKLYLNAINNIGRSGVFEIEFSPENGLPRTQFAFAGPQGGAWTVLPAPKTGNLEYRVKDGNEYSASGKVTMLPNVPVYRLGKTEKTIAFGNGQQIAFRCAKDALHFRAIIKDSEVVAPKMNDRDGVFSGDALEIFIDPEPFDNLDRDKIVTAIPLNAFQYAFSALGKDALSFTAFSRLNPKFKSQAKFRSEIVSGGYRIEGEIPWREFRLPGSGNVFGLEVELNQISSKNASSKELLSGASDRQGFSQRFHYPLFVLDDEAQRMIDGYSFVRNPDFTHGEFGDPADWCVNGFRKLNHLRHDAEKGVINLEAGEKTFPLNYKLLSAGQPVDIPAGATGCRMTMICRYNNVQGIGNPDYWVQGVMMSAASPGTDWGRSLKTMQTGTSGWRAIQFYAPLEKGRKQLNFRAGLRNATGSLTIDRLDLTFIRNSEGVK